MKQVKRSKANVVATLCLLALALQVKMNEKASHALSQMFYVASIGGLVVTSMCFIEYRKRGKYPFFWAICVSIFAGFSLNFWQSEYSEIWKMIIIIFYLIILSTIRRGRK